MRKVVAFLITILIILGCSITPIFAESNDSNSSKGYIDNSDVIPEYVPNNKVKLEDNGNGLLSPDWVKTLVIEEVNITYASDNGMFSGMDRTLDHLEEMGVNGIWLDPIFAPSQYLMYGPDTVNPALTGTEDDYEAGWQVVADFVEKAHDRNIRVFFDIITWGVHQAAPVVKEHRDWFNGIDPKYNGYNYNWDNPELVEWFSNQLVKIIETTNADGFRADTSISYCGYDVYRQAREELYKKGYYICMFTEGAVERLDVFDFEQNATIDAHFRDFSGTLFTETYNILDAVKKGVGLGTSYQASTMSAGQDRYYTSTLSHHDGYDYDVEGDIIKIGYSGILSPFIPLWYIGDEWNNPHVSADGNTWLYGNTINWSMLETHREFYENVKLLMRIRRVYSDIFDYYPQNHRQTNICAVETDHEDAIQAYARYKDNTAILVVPNADDRNSEWNITIPFEETGLNTDLYYTVTDLFTGEVLTKGNAQDISAFTAEIKRNELGVFAIETASKNDETTDNLDSSTSDNKNELIDSETSDSGNDKTTEPSEEVEKVLKRRLVKNKNTGSDNVLSMGWIIAIVIAVIAVFAVGIVVFIFVRRKRIKNG